MTHRRPRRFTDLQCIQIFLTDALTFMVWFDVLAATDNPSFPSIRVELNLYTITDKYFYLVQTHLAGQVREDDFPTLELYAEERVGKRLFDDSFNDVPRISHMVCARKNSRKRGLRQCVDGVAVATVMTMRPASAGNEDDQNGSTRACASSMPGNPFTIVWNAL